ncbi:MAG: hypothetical protein ABI860_12720 [Gemmatimonadales bacterium]
MGNGKTPLYLTLAAAVLFVLAVLTIQPYSVTSPWHVYDEPARLYLQAVARGDSLDLARRTSDPAAVRWALAAARTEPDTLALWAREASAWAGHRRGDATDVFLSTRVSTCDLVMRFVGGGKSARVERASSACLEPR